MFGITCTGLSPAKARLSRRFQLSLHEHWPGPRSLVTTNGISVDVFSSGYLDISVPQVRIFTPMYSAEDTFQITGNRAPKSRIPVIEGGLPHSEIHGSKFVRNSPRLVAAYHVLHRLLPPRHPLNALKSLDYSHYQCSPSAECASTIEKTRSSEINPTAARFVPLVLDRRLATLASGKSPIYDVCSSKIGRLFSSPNLVLYPLRVRRANWWSQTGSNRRPQACKASALPTELWPLTAP
jgi:hypothetical protein